MSRILSNAGHRLPATLAAALLTSTALASPALAQEASIVPFPVRQFADENGVDLLSGVYTAISPAVRIGSPEMGLTYARDVRGATFRDTVLGTISISGSTYTVAIGGQSEEFTLSGSVFTPVEQNGSSLSLSGTTYTYTRGDGTVATFDSASFDFGNGRGISISSLVYPSGRSLTFHYNTATYTNSSAVVRTGRRLQSVTTNAGYHMKLSYESDTIGDGLEVPWSRTIRVKGLNSSTDSCTVTAFSCPQTGRPELSIPPPTVGLGPSGMTIQSYTDAEGRTTTYTLAGGTPGIRPVTDVQLPGSTLSDVSVTYSGGQVLSITRFGVTTSYSYSDNGDLRTTTVSRPGGSTRVATFDLTKGVMLSDTNELGRTVSYQYDTDNRPKRITQPENNYTELTYDSRGNVIQANQVGKNGTSTLTSSAQFDQTCSNIVSCNKPNSITDANGNVSDYTWNSTHGGLLTVTRPAPTTGAVRPETRISYTRLGANGSSSPTGIFVPTAISECQTLASCAGAADEVKTTIAYAYGLQPGSISRGAGNVSLTATSAFGYDDAGNLLTVDGPLAGTADTTRYRYNLNREMVGVIGPDPDGAGALRNRAQRVTHGATGLVTKVESGTTAGQTDSAWNAFVPSEAVDVTHDSTRRPITQKLSSGGTAHALTQRSYDTRGRTECVAQRMNPAAYGSLPSSACTLGTQGSHGPDRVTQLVYDAASQVTEHRVGVGTSAAATERKLTYSNNGQAASLTDGNNNVTAYSYDTFDRLYTTTYPDGSFDRNVLYDGNGNITRFRNRGGQITNLTYDALNRPTFKNAPGTSDDVTYQYDNLGRLTSASHSGAALSFTYDALSRNLTQVGPQGTVTSEWDLAGHRTKVTYPGTGLYVNYDYLVTGEVSKIRENGASSGVSVLASYGYNDLGLRTSVAYGNGSSRSYAYDPISRLTSMSLTGLSPSSANHTVSNISYNPASQIVSQDRTAAYAWSNYSSVTRSHSINALNQVTQTVSSGLPNPISFTYDTKGNLTSDGTVGYCYDSENRLTGAGTPSNCNASATLAYDPFGRLRALTASATTTSFAYDGLNLIAEYNGSTLLRRYVHGPGMDEPILHYEGIGTTDRRWLYADERGSIVASADGSGNVIATNSYDEYGIPDSANSSRFQYTGQAWLPEVGLYYYKARLYSPTLGRFLQTDPIGYWDNANLYAYVGNDPINFVDPLGLEIVVIGDRCSLPEIACVESVQDSTTLVPNGPDIFVIARRLSELPPGQPQSEGDYCAGYQALKTAQSVVGVAGDAVGMLEDILSRTPAGYVPQARGFMIGLNVLEGLGGGGSAAIGLYLGYRYGDWRATLQGANDLLAGSAIAKGYRGLHNFLQRMEGKSIRGGDIVADVLGNIVPQGINFGSSGRCANE